MSSIIELDLMSHRFQIAVSACLLGQRVRYDGEEKTHSIMVDIYHKHFSDKINLVPFCPEVGIGLSVPRSKIQVVTIQELESDSDSKPTFNDEQTRVLGVENHRLDFTSPLISYAKRFIEQNPEIDIFIVKSKSPSCGYQSTPMFKQTQEGYQPNGFTSGLFVQTLLEMKPEVCIFEESQLNSRESCLDLLNDLLKPHT